MNTRYSTAATYVAAPSLLLLLLAPVFAGETVQIVRDQYGVPHIHADTDEGAYFGAGYAAAESRFFQMSWNRLKYQGRVAEFFGPGKGDEHIEHDRKARLLGWARHARAEAARLDRPTRRLLQAYADGVNAYLESPGRNLLGLFGRYGVPQDPWTVADCIGVWSRVGRFFQPDGLNEARNLHTVEYLQSIGASGREIFREMQPSSLIHCKS